MMVKVRQLIRSIVADDPLQINCNVACPWRRQADKACQARKSQSFSNVNAARERHHLRRGMKGYCVKLYKNRVYPVRAGPYGSRKLGSTPRFSIFPVGPQSRANSLLEVAFLDPRSRNLTSTCGHTQKVMRKGFVHVL